MEYINKKEGNDQESIQLSNTFRPRHKRERKTNLKQQPHNQNTTSKKPKGQFFSQKKTKRLSKINLKKCNHDVHANTYNDIKIYEYRDETAMRTRHQNITEVLKQKKINSGTPVGPTKARASSNNQSPYFSFL